MYFLVQFSVCVVDGSIGEGCASDVLRAVLRIPGAVEVENVEAPLLLVFELVDHLLQVAAELAVRREVLHYLETVLVVQHQLLELGVADHARIRLVPLLADGERQDGQQPHPPQPHVIIISRRNIISSAHLPQHALEIHLLATRQSSEDQEKVPVPEESPRLDV
jgi:hypothetical protein